jgi:DNA polymerase-3 subunit delta'
VTDLLLHPQTAAAIETAATNPSQAIVITGPTGVGKGSVLDVLAARLLETDTIEQHPGVLVVERAADKTEIGIDAVRRVQQFLTLKTTGEGKIRRIIKIQDAHLLSTEAQNALLKTIEEPPVDTVLLLSTTSLRQLLPTVASRLQELIIAPPSRQAVVEHFTAQNHAVTDVSKAVAMSGGLPGLTAALLAESGDHPMNQAADWARRLLGASRFERLAMIDELGKQRDTAINTCDVLGRMASLMLQNPKLSATQQMTWKTVLAQASITADQLRTFGNVKLALSSLSLHL